MTGKRNSGGENVEFRLKRLRKFRGGRKIAPVGSVLERLGNPSSAVPTAVGQDAFDGVGLRFDSGRIAEPNAGLELRK